MTLLALLLLGARVYHTEPEALAAVFPDATAIEPRSYLLDPEARSLATERAGVPVRDRAVVFHEARHAGRLLGYAVVLREKAKTFPFRFLVAIRPDGAVEQVLLLTFREPRGYEIERRAFRTQYRGKTLEDPIRRGRDIRNVTGATISVDSLSRGVRRALALYEVLVRADRP